MPVDQERISVEFHLAARAIFFQLSKKFRKDAGPLSREVDENVFQQQQSRFLFTLKTRLDDLAMGIMDKYKQCNPSDALRLTLTGYINSYLSEFEQKNKFL